MDRHPACGADRSLTDALKLEVDTRYKTRQTLFSNSNQTPPRKFALIGEGRCEDIPESDILRRLKNQPKAVRESRNEIAAQIYYQQKIYPDLPTELQTDLNRDRRVRRRGRRAESTSERSGSPSRSRSRSRERGQPRESREGISP